MNQGNKTHTRLIWDPLPPPLFDEYENLMNMKIWWIQNARKTYVCRCVSLHKRAISRYPVSVWEGQCYRQMVCPMPDRTFGFPVMHLERTPLQHFWKQRFGSLVFLPPCVLTAQPRTPLGSITSAPRYKEQLGLFSFIESLQGLLIPFSIIFREPVLHSSIFPHFNLLKHREGK